MISVSLADNNILLLQVTKSHYLWYFYIYILKMKKSCYKLNCTPLKYVEVLNPSIL